MTLHFGGDQLASPPGDFPKREDSRRGEGGETQCDSFSGAWNVGRHRMSDQTRVRIEIVRNPDVYVYKWVVARFAKQAIEQARASRPRNEGCQIRGNFERNRSSMSRSIKPSLRPSRIRKAKPSGGRGHDDSPTDIERRAI